MKAEVRHGIKLESPHKSNLYYTLGLSYAFDKDNQALPQSEKSEYSTTIVNEEIAVDKKAVVKTIVLTSKNFNFNFDSAQVLESGANILKEAVEYLKTNPDLNIRILIESHTDSTGSDEYNMNLSQKRADAAKSKLVEYGIEADKIATKAYGESNPVATNETEEGRFKNRRVEIIFVQ